ncbi:RNA polymerase sigma factor [Pseudonocardia sp. GCM10023141]|uniref:RNA polymerase sigma factor n=1 Tax=Pseudonocardia sp. GCM10023141 TaxID=3252653 RepID=UPI00361C9EF3
MGIRDLEDLLRSLAPQALGVLVRRYGNFAAAEDAVQEALIAAAQRWPRDGVPEHPSGWLIQTALRKLTDQFRSEQARRRREDLVTQQEQAVGEVDVADQDDTLELLFLCCHPVLTPASAVALTLRAVGGLTTAEIAAAFLVPEATMAQRISRAKQRIAASDEGFRTPGDQERERRLAPVLRVLYLMFNEGYTASSGADLQRVDLAQEAIRLTRTVHALLPADGEVTGLLALMLLTDARRPARTGPGGELVPLTEQDRALWDRDRIAEGVGLVVTAMSRGRVGEYQLQASIAAVHDGAPSAADTDWAQIVTVYDLLGRITDNPMVALNRAVAVAMVQGPAAGLALLEPLDERLPGHHRLDAVRGHLHAMLGDHTTAARHFGAAARRATSLPEQRYLTAKAAQAVHR